MVPSASLAVFSVVRGMIKIWKIMAEKANITSNFRPSVLMFFNEFLWPSLR